jgi:cytochrome c-type biogenesis protein CcmE
MKAKHRRLMWILAGLASIALALTIILNHFNDQIIFFYTPTQLNQTTIVANKTIRIGGLVKPGSIIKEDTLITHFILTDNEHEVNVTYDGIVPNLFREGQGTVALGAFNEKQQFIAKTLLTKHDEKYMPPELSNALRDTGHWRQP